MNVDEGRQRTTAGGEQRQERCSSTQPTVRPSYRLRYPGHIYSPPRSGLTDGIDNGGRRSAKTGSIRAVADIPAVKS